MNGVNGVLAKIFGWGQFGLMAVSQVAQNGAPHGAAGWLSFIGSMVTAVGIHAASNVGQVKNQPSPSTFTVTPTSHISQ